MCSRKRPGFILGSKTEAICDASAGALASRDSQGKETWDDLYESVRGIEKSLERQRQQELKRKE